jgi:hypothetical protein
LLGWINCQQFLKETFDMGTGNILLKGQNDFSTHTNGNVPVLPLCGLAAQDAANMPVDAFGNTWPKYSPK